MSMNRFIHCFLIFIAVQPSLVTAQRCGATCADAESLLGSSEESLVGFIPELQRLTKPIQGPRNSRGKWGLPNIRFAAQPFAVTYYIGTGRVTRIELLSTATRQQCTARIPFEQAFAKLVEAYGDSQAADKFEESGKTMESVAFGTPTMDISLYYALSQDDCTTRVIYKTREVKDASEL